MSDIEAAASEGKSTRGARPMLAPMRAILVAAVVSTFVAPSMHPPPGTPCVGFYATTCSIIELIPDDPSQTPGDVRDAVCRRTDCTA
jgi:hypothetical protein